MISFLVLNGVFTPCPIASHLLRELFKNVAYFHQVYLSFQEGDLDPVTDVEVWMSSGSA